MPRTCCGCGHCALARTRQNRFIPLPYLTRLTREAAEEVRAVWVMCTDADVPEEARAVCQACAKLLDRHFSVTSSQPHVKCQRGGVSMPRCQGRLDAFTLPACVAFRELADVLADAARAAVVAAEAEAEAGAVATASGGSLAEAPCFGVGMVSPPAPTHRVASGTPSAPARLPTAQHADHYGAGGDDDAVGAGGGAGAGDSPYGYMYAGACGDSPYDYAYAGAGDSPYGDAYASTDLAACGPVALLATDLDGDVDMCVGVPSVFV